MSTELDFFEGFMELRDDPEGVEPAALPEPVALEEGGFTPYPVEQFQSPVPPEQLDSLLTGQLPGQTEEVVVEPEPEPIAEDQTFIPAQDPGMSEQDAYLAGFRGYEDESRGGPLVEAQPPEPEEFPVLKEVDDVLFENSMVPFVQRIIDPPRFPRQYVSPLGDVSPHRKSDEDVEENFRMMYTNEPNSSGKFIVYPSVRYDKDSQSLFSDRSPVTAMQQGNFISFDSKKEAKDFATNGYKSSIAFKSGMYQEYPSPGTPLDEDLDYVESPFYDEDSQETLHGQLSEEGKSRRPFATAQNGRRFFLDIGPSPNPTVNLARQMLETGTYRGENERELLAQTVANGIVAEASGGMSEDGLLMNRPLDAKYGREKRDSLAGFREASEESSDFITNVVDGWNYSMKGQLEPAHLAKFRDDRGGRAFAKKVAGEGDQYISTDIRQYAESLATESIFSLNQKDRDLVSKYLEDGIKGYEGLDPSDWFFKTENLTSYSGKVLGQLAQLPAILPSLLGATGTAFAQGKSRPTGSVTGDVNYSNQFNQKLGSIYQEMQVRDTALSERDVDLEARTIIEQIQDPEGVFSPGSKFKTLGTIGAGSYQYGSNDNTVRLHPSDVAHIFRPEILDPWQAGLLEHIKLQHKKQLNIKQGHQFKALNSQYYRPEEIFERNKISAALSWVDAVDPDNPDAVFLKGYRGPSAPSGGWAADVGGKSAREQARKDMGRLSAVDLEAGGLLAREAALGVAAGQAAYGLSRKVDQERMSAMAKEGVFGSAYKNDAGAFIAQFMSDLSAREKSSEFNTVLSQYADGVLSGMAPDVQARDIGLAYAGLGIGYQDDEEFVKEGEKFWKQYPVFAFLSLAVPAQMGSKLFAGAAVRSGLKLSAASRAASGAGLNDALSLFARGQFKEGSALWDKAMLDYKNRYKDEKAAALSEYEDSVRIANSPLRRLDQSKKIIKEDKETVFVDNDRIEPTIIMYRKEAEGFRTKAQEMESSGEAGFEKWNKDADTSEALADALQTQYDEMSRAKSSPGVAPILDNSRDSLRRQEYRTEAELALETDRGRALNNKRKIGRTSLPKVLRKHGLLGSTLHKGDVRSIIGQILDPKNSDQALEYAQRLSAAGETDARVYGVLLPKAGIDEITDLVYKASKVPENKRISTVLEDIAIKNNTTVDDLLDQQNRISTAELLSKKGETSFTAYEILGLSDDQVDYFVKIAENNSLKAYVTSKRFGDGIELSVKNAVPHRGRFLPGMEGLGQVVGRNIFSPEAVSFRRQARESSGRTKTMNNALAVASFMERPFSMVNIPSWFGDFVNWQLHRQYAKGAQGALGSILERTFSYMASRSSMLGEDVYRQLRSGQAVEDLAKADINQMMDVYKNGGLNLQEADVVNALAELNMFNEEFGDSRQFMRGLTNLGEDEYTLMAEVIHRGIEDQVFRYNNVDIRLSDVMSLQVKRNGVWEDAIDERANLDQIINRKKELSTTVKSQFSENQLKEIAAKGQAGMTDDVRLRLEKQVTPEELALVKQELSDLIEQEKTIKSITKEQALEGVEGLRWVPSKGKTYADLGDRERAMIAVANYSVAPVSSKIFSVVSDIILGEENLGLNIKSASPRGTLAVVTREVQGLPETVGAAAVEAKKRKETIVADLGSSKKSQERANMIAVAVNNLMNGDAMPKGLSRQDRNMAIKLKGEMKPGQTMEVVDPPKRVEGKRAVDFSGYEVIPKLANYVSTYFIKEAEAGHAMKLLKKFKSGEITPSQYKAAQDSLARKYLMLIPNEKEARAFVDKAKGVGTYDNNPVRALQFLMDSSEPQLAKKGIIFEGSSRYFKTRMWAKGLSFEDQLQSLSDYRHAATQTYLGLVQRRESLRFQKVLRDNGLLITKDEFNSLGVPAEPGQPKFTNKNAFVNGKAIKLPGLAKAVLEFKVGKEEVAAGGNLSNFYVHKSVARDFANQHVLFRAQQNFFVRLNNAYKIGAVVNPVTGTMARNVMGMMTFQSVAADIPFRGKYALQAYSDIKKLKSGNKDVNPIVRELAEEGILGNLIAELGDPGTSRAAVEKFYVGMIAGKDKKGSAGKVLDAINSDNPGTKTISELTDNLMGPDDVFNGLVDDMSLISGSDDAFRKPTDVVTTVPGQRPRITEVDQTFSQRQGSASERAAQAIKGAPRKAVRTAEKANIWGRGAYGGIDDVGRLAYALELAIDHKMPAREAAMIANKVMFDYPDVSMLTSIIRTNPFSFGMPFIGYQVWANEAFGNLISRQTSRAWLMTGLAKAHISATETMLGTAGLTDVYQQTEADYGALPMPSIKASKATSSQKKRLRRLGYKDANFVVGPEYAPGYMWSSFADSDALRAFNQAEANDENMDSFDKVMSVMGALVSKQGFTGKVIGDLLAPPRFTSEGSADEISANRSADVSVALETAANSPDLPARVEKMSSLELLGGEVGEWFVENQPFFGAAVRGLVGAYSAYGKDGEPVFGIDSTKRDVINKALGFSSRLWDPRFARSLENKGKIELRVARGHYKALIDKAAELDKSIQRAGLLDNKKALEKERKAVDSLVFNVLESIENIQYENGMLKAATNVKVAQQLERVKIAISAMARGGDIDPMQAELLNSESPYMLPPPPEEIIIEEEFPEEFIDEDVPEPSASDDLEFFEGFMELR